MSWLFGVWASLFGGVFAALGYRSYYNQFFGISTNLFEISIKECHRWAVLKFALLQNITGRLVTPRNILEVQNPKTS